MTTTEVAVTLPKNNELLNLYKLEKEAMDLPSDPFPSFKEWRDEYMIEFIDSHVDSKMVDVETAVAETEKELDEEKDSIEQQTPVLNPRACRYQSSKSVTTKPKVKPTTKTKTPKKAPANQSKKEMAITIYKSMMVGKKHPERKDVIARFIKDIGMSSAGASTYHHTIKQMF